MTARMRPSGAGKAAACVPFLRATATPRAALLVRTDAPAPDDWPVVEGVGASDAPLGHAVGWVCEVRAGCIVIVNPLGEGLLRAELPELSDEWLHDVRDTTSSAIYLLGTDAGEVAADEVVDAAAFDGPVTAASVRTAVDEAYGRSQAVGRNDPCPCGSGKKYKQCHMNRPGGSS